MKTIISHFNSLSCDFNCSVKWFDSTHIHNDNCVAHTNIFNMFALVVEVCKFWTLFSNILCVMAKLRVLWLKYSVWCIDDDNNFIRSLFHSRSQYVPSFCIANSIWNFHIVCRRTLIAINVRKKHLQLRKHWVQTIILCCSISLSRSSCACV